ncbi:MAG: endonuclease MutS2 [Acidobacteriaceae bacterium]
MVPNVPLPLAHTSAAMLEFARLREMVTGYATTAPGREWTLALEPSGDAAWASAEQQRVSDALRLLCAGSSFDFHGLIDPGDWLDRARIAGAVLEVDELRALSALVGRFRAFQEWMFGLPEIPGLRIETRGTHGEVAPDHSIPSFANNATRSTRLGSLRAGSAAAAHPEIFQVSSAAAERPGAPTHSDSLRQLAAPLIAARFAGLVQALDGKFEGDGSIADHASPELARIRRQMERQQRAIEDSLRAMLRRLGPEGGLQEDLITVRGERFVLPVKAEWKRRVPGVMHGASSSGQTYFIEPIETIEQNNELQRLLEEEQAEERRILAAMTRQVGEHADAIRECAKILAEVESLFARARFAADFHCVAPVFSAPGSERIFLKAARHPLLEKRLREPMSQKRDMGHPDSDGCANSSGQLNSIPPFAMEPQRVGRPDSSERSQKTQVSFANLGHPHSSHAELSSAQRVAPAKAIVPLDLELAAATPQLIISGPNTGGKTVALKTVGLLALMAQAGIPVPAEAAELPLFDAVLADIGDAQSIEQDLSSFSAHITRLNEISDLATASSLVLLDELGSATDPEEGAALAAAIAAHFCARHAWCLISTHHTSLKVYAANTPGVQNAAAGFEEDTFAPTYHIRVGVPGVSAGIHIAERLGMDAAILADAKERLGKQTVEIGRFLDRLHADLLAVNTERAQLQRREEEIAKERQRLEREGRQEQQRKVQEMEGKLSSLLKAFEAQVREVLRGIEDRSAQQKVAKQAERGLAKLRREFRDQVDATVVAHRTGADRGDPNARPHIVRSVNVGDIVKLRSLGKTAVVERQVDAENFEVSVGQLKMRIRRNDIAEVVTSAADRARQATPVAARSKGIRVSLNPERAAETSAGATEINVIGRTVEEATDAVEKFLDDAFLEGLPRVRIVHGVGMGILRKALRTYLGKHPQVDKVSEPPQNEGGAGATVVELRQ